MAVRMIAEFMTGPRDIAEQGAGWFVGRGILADDEKCRVNSPASKQLGEARHGT